MDIANKIIRKVDESKVDEGNYEFLHALKKDPDELQNVYGDSKQAKVTARLKKRLQALQKHYQDDSDISEKPKEWKQKVRPTKG